MAEPEPSTREIGPDDLAAIEALSGAEPLLGAAPVVVCGVGAAGEILAAFGDPIGLGAVACRAGRPAARSRFGAAPMAILAGAPPSDGVAVARHGAVLDAISAVLAPSGVLAGCWLVGLA